MIPPADAERGAASDTGGTADRSCHAAVAAAATAGATNEEIPATAEMGEVRGQVAQAIMQNPPQERPPPSISRDEDGEYAEAVLNLTLFDPPRYGWTALGGVADLLPPHERSRRRTTCMAYRKDLRRQRWPNKNKASNRAATAQKQHMQMQGGEASIRSGGTRGAPRPSDMTIQPTNWDQQQQQGLQQGQQQLQSFSYPSMTSMPPPYNSSGQENYQQQERTEGGLKHPPSYSVAPEGPEAQPAKSSGNESQQGQVPIGQSTNQSMFKLSLVPPQRQDAPNPPPIPPQGPIDRGDGTKPQELLTISSTVHPMQMLSRPVPEAAVPPPAAAPEIDIGVKLTGLSTDILGMTIRRKPPNTSDDEKQDDTTNTGHTNNTNDNPTEAEACDNATTAKTNANSKRRPGGAAAYECTVQALKDGVLDMYSYHRGREGMEARDAESGELLCLPEATDTNHSIDAPKLVASVTIQFPLLDDDDDDDDDDDVDFDTPEDAKEEGRAMYRDVLEWDLSDPTTPSPLTFAASIARDFGLDFGQTMNLAASIEQQIDAHILQNAQYSEPIAIKDPKGLVERGRQPGPTIQAYRYDQVIDTGKGGIAKPRKERVNPRTGSSGGISTNQPSFDLETDEEVATSAASSGVKLDSSNVLITHVQGRRAIVENGVAEESIVGSGEVDAEDDEVQGSYHEEVKKQARAASALDVRQKCKNGIVGMMEQLSNSHCHICHKRCDVGFSFACENKSHIYCAAHVNSRLEISRNSSGAIVYDSCPVCSLNCTCAKCTRKLNNVVKIFKAMCLTQRKEPSDVPFPGVLDRCCLHQTQLSKEMSTAEATILSHRKKQRLAALAEQQTTAPVKQQAMVIASPASAKSQASTVRRLSSLHSGGPKQGMVPKPPLIDFPREMYNGEELEVGTAEDYFTVFSATGQRSVNDVPDAWMQEENQNEQAPSLSEKDGVVVEDGNVDYCYMCRTPGNLFCCDFCPRAYHSECIQKAGHSSPSDSRWECFTCRKERIGSDDDFVDGENSIDLICASFLDIEPSDEGAFNGLQVLSRIHDMLVKLMAYDFGTLFNSPVNVEAIPGYKELVKHPMDLGTICYKLINKGYSALYEEVRCMDDVVSSVLEDVELVWHNCFLFNAEGTSVYRMGEVQRRRAQMIQKRSFDHLLSERVKDSVRTFALGAEKARAASPSKVSATKARTTNGFRERAMKDMKPRGKNKITTDARSPGKSIAVLDTVSGRVVRVYSTSKAASQAVHILRSCGHRCEWNCDAITNLNMKLIAQRCGRDPRVLMFGYRWVFLQELRAGQVAFLPPTFDIVEMRQSHCTFVFQSIEEALSSSVLPSSVELGILRKKLLELHRNGKWTEICGLNWRLPLNQAQECQAPHAETQNEGIRMEQNRPITFVGLPPSVNSDSERFGERYWRNCAVVKRDLVTNRNLVGFEYLPLALKDWMQTTAASPMFPQTEARTIENFKKYYLDGDRNVDGIVWRSGGKSKILPPTNAATDHSVKTAPVDGVSKSGGTAIAESRTTQGALTEGAELNMTEAQSAALPTVDGLSELQVDKEDFSGPEMTGNPFENGLKRKRWNGGNEMVTARKEALLATNGDDQNEEPNNARGQSNRHD